MIIIIWKKEKKKFEKNERKKKEVLKKYRYFQNKIQKRKGITVRSQIAKLTVKKKIRIKKSWKSLQQQLII